MLPGKPRSRTQSEQKNRHVDYLIGFGSWIIPDSVKFHFIQTQTEQTILRGRLKRLKFERNKNESDEKHELRSVESVKGSSWF